MTFMDKQNRKIEVVPFFKGAAYGAVYQETGKRIPDFPLQVTRREAMQNLQKRANGQNWQTQF